MGGGDHHTGNGIKIFYRIRNGGGRCIRLCQVDSKTIGRQDAGHVFSIAIGQETRIETDYELSWIRNFAAVARFIPGLTCNCIGNGLSKHTQVVEGKGV